MKNLNKFISLSSRVSKRYFSVKKSKYIDPEEAYKLPLIDKPISKQTYNRVYVWGNTQTGALGVPYLKSNEDPSKVSCLRHPKRLKFAEKFEILAVASGFGYTIFSVKNDSDIKLFATGINTDSQLGYHCIRQGKPLELLFLPQPLYLPFTKPEAAEILNISAGRAHSAILTNEGLFMLGSNCYGQCGRKIVENENYLQSNYIHLIENLDGKRIVDIECGQDHSLAITEDGSLYSTGWSADGQTGLGHYKSTHRFTKVSGDIEKEKIVKVACRSDFVLALNDKGEVFGWGNTEYGQMTLPDNSQQLCNPTYIDMLKHLGKIKDVASGGSLCSIVNDNGEVFTWGYGLLGVGPAVVQSSKPVKIPETLFGRNDFQPDNIVEKVRCGLSHCFAITNLGDLFAWGRNRNNCLGLGSDKDQHMPLKVSVSGLVQDVTSAVDHTIAMCKPFI